MLQRYTASISISINRDTFKKKKKLAHNAVIATESLTQRSRRQATRNSVRAFTKADKATPDTAPPQ